MQQIKTAITAIQPPASIKANAAFAAINVAFTTLTIAIIVLLVVCAIFFAATLLI